MKHILKKTMIGLLSFIMVLSLIIPPVLAEEAEDATEITAQEAGVSEQEAAEVTEETRSVITETGMLIEIGNTTAEETTIIIRVTRDGVNVDQTVQVDSDTRVVTDSRRSADLSDWIAGDQITYIAEEGDNSGELIAIELRNRSFKRKDHGRNGWIKDIRADQNEIDVEWAGTIYTLNTTNARMVAGLKNPASLEDFEVNDRIRARVKEDYDGNNLTWDAEIIVVLRRGENLFMRVTRWVVPAEIVSIPEDTTTYPILITAEVLPSKFYEEGDVNNLVGAPGTIITISIDEDTKLVRRFLGKTEIGEFSEGDKIRMVGRLNDSTGYVDSEVVKNKSIQRLGVSNRLAEVVSVDSSAGTLIAIPIAKKNPRTKRRKRIRNAGEWTVTTTNETKIKKSGEDINISSVESGDIIRIRGIANRKTHIVTANRISVVTDRYNEQVED